MCDGRAGRRRGYGGRRDTIRESRRTRPRNQSVAAAVPLPQSMGTGTDSHFDSDCFGTSSYTYTSWDTETVTRSTVQ